MIGVVCSNFLKKAYKLTRLLEFIKFLLKKSFSESFLDEFKILIELLSLKLLDFAIMQSTTLI